MLCYSFTKSISKKHLTNSLLPSISNKNLIPKQIKDKELDISIIKSNTEALIKALNENPYEIIADPKNLTDDEISTVFRYLGTLGDNQLKSLMKSEDYTQYFLQNIIKRMPNIETNALIKISQQICQNPLIMRDNALWPQLLQEFKDRAMQLTLDEIADTLWCFAYANKGDPKFFRLMENALFDNDIEELHHKNIGKILWGFSHSNTGSTILYSSIANQIKRIHVEIKPKKLAEFAYYFSKASNSVEGGFGVYTLAEKAISDNIKAYNFQELCKIIDYLIPQNIGSNKFYIEVENRLNETFPNEMEPSDLVLLCKALSIFRFQTKLGTKIERVIMKYMEYLSNRQLEYILWSYTRGNKGSKEFYEKIEDQLIKRLKLMKPRSIAFSFYGLALVSKGSMSLMKKYEEIIIENLDKFSMHYLIKIMIGLIKRNDEVLNSSKSNNDESIKVEEEQVIQNEERISLLQRIIDKITRVSDFNTNTNDDNDTDVNNINDGYNTNNKYINKSEIIKILNTLADYPAILYGIDYENLYDKLEKKLLNEELMMIKELTIEDACLILFSYISKNKGSSNFITQLLTKIGDINNITKTTFCQALFSIIQLYKTDLYYDFIRIINDLASYGEIKYFFDHENFIRLIWSLCIIITEDPNVIEYLPNLAKQNIKEALFDINVNTLRIDIIGLYMQIWPMLRLFSGFDPNDEKQLYAKFEEFNEELKKDIINNDLTNLNDINIRNDISTIFDQYIKENNLKGTCVNHFCDEFYNLIDMVLIDEDSGYKCGIVIYNQHHYLKAANKPKVLYKTIQNKITILRNIFKWNIIEIDENEWKVLLQQEKLTYLNEKLKGFALMNIMHNKKANLRKKLNKRKVIDRDNKPEVLSNNDDDDT